MVNLYLKEKNDKNDNPQEIDNRFDDLTHFVEYFASQRCKDVRVSSYPLRLHANHPLNIVDEPLTSKLLKKLKSKVEKFLKKSPLIHEGETKQLKWSRIKKLIENSKF